MAVSVKIVGGAVAPWLVRSTPECEPWPGTLCCVLGQDTLLSQCLSPPMYKWVPANLILGVTLRWTSIPSRGSRNTPSHLKGGLKSHLARMQTLPLLVKEHPRHFYMRVPLQGQ